MNETGLPYYVSFTTRAGAGDYICLLSACREFIRRTGNTVYTDNMPDVIAAYQDPNFLFGKEGLKFQLHMTESHREKQAGDYVNYYGTFLAAMGLLRKGDIPKLELPKFEPEEPKVLIQPISVFALNPSLGYVQGMVDRFIQLTGKKVYVVGKESTPRVLKNVDYSLLQDGLTHVMRHVQNAEFVMCPRSLMAHLAAGYGRPSFVWVPEDGENWHLDYPDWPRVSHSFAEGELVGGEIIKAFVRNHLSGEKR